MSKNLLFTKLLILFIHISSISFAQQLNSRLEFFSNQQINGEINKSDQSIHTGFKALDFLKINQIKETDSISFIIKRDLIFSEKFRSRWIYRKFRNENFIDYKSENFRLKINPLFNLELKRDRKGTSKMFTNTRGIELFGDIGKKVYFYSSFYENQARFEPYITEYIKQTLVVPGQGAPKFLAGDKFDFSMASGYIFFNIGQHLNLEFGHSKHFVGEGYRSLLLSDNAFNYPFLKLTGTFGQFQYLILWSQHQLFKNAYYDYHMRKYNSINYISWVPKTGLEFSLFESVEWPGNWAEDGKFSINFFNPLIFFRSFQYGLDGKKNVLVGFNTKIKIYDFAQFFGQLVLDKIDKDVKADNNFAFQLGIKHFDIFHQKFPYQKLFAHMEFNYIAPYTYTQQSAIQSHTHYNQPLAHPAGTGLKESLGIIEYSYKDFSLRIKGSYIINSLDTLNSNFGSSIFMPNEVLPGIVSHIGNKVGQGLTNKTLQINTELIFLINPSSNLQLFAQLLLRKVNNPFFKNDDLIFSFGIRTKLNNLYYDF